ncbi:hypothetical protein BJX96DRAFT_20221 [Aspergillus floccosus]
MGNRPAYPLVILTAAASTWLLALAGRCTWRRYQQSIEASNHPWIPTEVTAAGTVRRGHHRLSSGELESYYPVLEYKHWKDRQLSNGPGCPGRSDREARAGNKWQVPNRPETRRRTVSCPVPYNGSLSQYAGREFSEHFSLATIEAHNIGMRKPYAHAW